ncbi:MAG TPA: hypothetical protein VFU21_05980 [Kofleriaceae bacterium]|nr:hypothetical protein [Kofleriaceae bacterium]
MRIVRLAAAAWLCGCVAMPAEPGDDPGLEEVLAGGVSRIRADDVYVRWAPGSATIDYFLRGDEVDMHGTAREGKWACVTGTTRYGLRHTGWVLRSTVTRASGDGYEGTARCKYGPDDLDQFEVTFRNCRIRARGAFRNGPRSDAGRLAGPRAPDGFLDPAQGRTCVGRASDSQGGTRAAEGDHVWVAWRPDKDPTSNKAPGRTGWFRHDLLDCSAGVSCRDDVGAVAAGALPGGCGDGSCQGDEDDTSCPADCGCGALEVCAGVAPFGCYCDPTCAETGDCCADVATCP